VVGEIGLDNFRFDAATKELVSPFNEQLAAFEMQLELATRLRRPVSIHSVQSWGPMMDVISKVKNKFSDGKDKNTLPPKLYFHAFGGKAGTVNQILALCGDCGRRRYRAETPTVFFGFAPVINFRSPKTAEIVRKVGIDRLLLETDHEDAAYVLDSIREGIRFLSMALQLEEDVVIEKTTRHAPTFYGL